MKYIIWLLRIALGGLFIFSGLVKANDPMGLTYKMGEFFDVWHWNFMTQNIAFWLSVFMIAFEIIAGVAMFVGNSFRMYITLMLLMNIFYTFLTGYVFYTDKINECGCFGDCFKISNSATFYKDIAITAVNLFLFIFRYRVFPIFKKSAINFSIVFLAVLFSIGFQWWVLHHLPYHDCLPYKVGNNLLEKMSPAKDATPAVTETTLTYEKNGIQKEFPMDKLPTDKEWKWVSTNTKVIKEATGEPQIHDFILSDKSGNNVAKDILSKKGYLFLWFVKDPKKGDTINLNRINTIIAKTTTEKIPFYALVSEIGIDDFKTYAEVWDMKNVPFFMLDGTVNKTAMRTNMGLMLLKDGIVIGKWSYLDYPKDITVEGDNLICK